VTVSPAQTSADRPAGDPHATRRVARGALALLSTQPFTWSASLAVAILVPRFLGDSSLGEYGIAWSIASLAANIAALGMQNFLTRKVALQPEHAAAHAWGAVAIVTVCSLALSVAVMVAVMAFRVTGVSPSLAAIALVGGLLSAIQAVVQAVLIGLGRNARYAVSVAGTQVLISAVGIITLLLGGDVYAYAVAGLGGWVVSTAFLLRTSGLRFSRDALEPKLLRALVAGGLPFLGWNVALRIRGGLDVILLGALLQPNVAGWLVAAYRIINVPVFIPTIVTTPLMPVLSRARADPAAYRRLLAGSLETVLFLTVPVSAGIFALAPLIPDTLGWSESLRHAIPVITVLAFQQPLVAVDMVLGVSLIALGLERPWVRFMMAGAILNPLSNLMAIPAAQILLGNGAVGAAFVELLTELFLFAGALYLTPRGLLGRDVAFRALRVVAAGALLIIVARILLPYGPIPAALGGGITYIGAALALGVVRRQQLRAVRLALRPAA
jgi:O-antigen/teichoic acid export membrane protein